MPRVGLKREDVQSTIRQWLADDVGVGISKGNSKLQKIPNLSLTPGKTCPGEIAECRWCYAKRCMQFSTWSEVRWTVNTFYARNNLSRFQMDVLAHIHLSRAKYFRIHVGGDFFSQRYFNTWCNIANELKNVRFLAFTKSFDLDFSRTPANLQLIFSVAPSTDFRKVPRGPRAWVDYRTIGLEYPPALNDLFLYAHQCVGGCESCGMCFYADHNNMNVRFDARGRAFDKLQKGANGKWLSKEQT